MTTMAKSDRTAAIATVVGIPPEVEEGATCKS